jgi:hypothetical protein
MPKIIEVGDMVYKAGEIPVLDNDYGLVSEAIEDKYTGAKYITVYWLYKDISETIMEHEVTLYKKSVKAYGKFKKEGPMGVEDWLEEIKKLIKKPAKY